MTSSNGSMREFRSGQVSIRRATLADLEVLQKFEQGIITAERPFDAMIKEGEVHYYDIGAMIASDDAFVAIAEANGEAVGCGMARRAASRQFVRIPEYAYVGMMYVVPGFRGRGISRLILGSLAEWARGEGLLEMKLEVYPANASAIRSYEKAGFAPYMLEMTMPLFP